MIFGLLWIVLSDLALTGAGGLTDQGFFVAAGKGSVFVLLSAGLVFWLCRREFRAVARGNALLRAVIDGTSDAVFVKDREGRYLLCNESAARFLGRPIAEVLGRDDSDLFEASEAKQLMASDRSILARGSAVTAEETLTAAGVTRTFHAMKAPFLDETGGVAGLIGIARDITERKANQEILRISEERFRGLAEVIPQIVWTADRNGALTYVNLNGTDRKNLKVGELVGWEWERETHPDDLAHAKAKWTYTLRDGVPRPFEMRIRRADGAYRWHICRQRPIRNAGGDIASWVGTCTDIDELKQIETALRVTDARLQEAQRIARLGSWSWEPPTNTVWWSDAEFELFGMDRRIIQPSFEAFLSILHPDDRAVAVARVEAMRKGADEFADDMRVVRADGAVVWIHSRGRASRDDNGSLVRVEGTDQDVTARKRGEAELREARRMLRIVLDAVPHGIFWKDREGRHLGCNMVVARALGFATPDEVIGRTNADLPSVTAEEADNFTRRDREVILTGMPQLAVDESLSLPDARKIQLETYKLPLLDDRGRTIGVVGMWQDVTARKQADRALQESETRLQAAIEVAGLGIIVVDYDTQTANLSPHASEQFGMEPGRPVARTELHARFHPEDQAEIQRLSDIALDPTGKGWFALEHRVVRPDGAVRWLNVRKQVAFSQGRPQHAVVVTADVTDRRIAEETLRASEIRYRLMFESNPHPMWVYDVDTLRFRSVNDAAVMAYGYSRAEFLAMTIRDIRPSEDMPRLDASFAHLTDEVRHLAPWKHRRKDGTVFDVEVSSHALPSEGHRSRLVLALDVSERLRAEQDLRAERDRFEKLMVTVPLALCSFHLAKDGKVTMPYASPRIEPIYRIPVADLARDASMVFSAMHPDDAVRAHASIEESARDITVWREEFRVRRPGQGEIWIEGCFAPARLPDESVLWHGYINDVTARKQAESMLRESERRFRTVFENAAIGIAITDATGRFLQVNPAYSLLLGYSEAELLRMDSPALVHPDDAAENNDGLRNLTSGEMPSFEAVSRYLDRSGGIVWVRKFVSRLHGKGDGPPHLLFLVLDISDQRRADEALRGSEERFRTLIEFLPDAVFLNTGGTVVYANRACVRLLGVDSPTQLYGKSPYDLIHPDYHAAVRERIALMRDTNLPVGGLDEEVVRPDGTRAPVHVTAIPVVDRTGPAILVVMHDLTERKRVESQLRHQELLLREAAELAHVGGWGFDPVTRAPDWTEEVARVYDLPSSDPPAVAEALAYYDPSCRARLEQALAAATRDGTPHDLELKLTTPSGNTKWVRTICRPIIEGGKVVRVRGSLQDITARKSLEEQLHQAQKMEAVGRLAGGVAHDFNNLLTVINGYSDMLLAELPVGDPAREMLTSIHDAGERAARLTQQLLAFSRKSVVEPRLVDLNELVTESAKLLRRLIGEDVALSILASPGPVRVIIDPGQFEQVLMNLAVNARDAMPTGGRLSIETRSLKIGADADADRSHIDLPPGWYASLRVADTGCGMNEETRIKIFEPFFTTKGVGKGTGLGLAVVHGVVKQAGGTVEVESAVGVGTTFTVLLPNATGSNAGAVSKVTRVAPRGIETVLLVEDEDAVRMLVRVALEGQGYTVLAASDGEEALALLRENPNRVDMLVTDVIMPGMSGRELAEAARKARQGLRVLYMSGYTDDALDRHGLEGAAVKFIQKPFSPLELARRVRAILDQSE